MTISNSMLQDTDEIFRLYAAATQLQKEKGVVTWPTFERAMVEAEINAGQQWKLTEGDAITCVWATTFHDPQIWEDLHDEPSLYIHRIATNPAFRGRALVQRIVQWARTYAAAQGKKYVRMDTVGNNRPLIAHYQRCGFDVLGFSRLKNTAGLPSHYQQDMVCLFQLEAAG